jgi:hypothetical protein
MKTIVEKYYLLHYKIYCFLNWSNGNDLGINDWSAVIIIGALQVFLILTVDMQLEILLQKSVDCSIWFATIGGLLIAAGNYFVFLKQDKWKSHVSHFKAYPRVKNIKSNLWVACLCILVPILFIVSAYQYSLVDWRKIIH